MLYHGSYKGADQPTALSYMIYDGPLLYVQLSLPQALSSLLIGMGQDQPAPIVGRTLIDTGASHSAFDAKVLASLGISPTGVTVSNTAGGPQKQDTYWIQMTVPSHSYTAELTKVAGVDLSGQKTITGEPIIGLLGRDFLSSFILVYNGQMGQFTLAN